MVQLFPRFTTSFQKFGWDELARNPNELNKAIMAYCDDEQGHASEYRHRSFVVSDDISLNAYIYIHLIVMVDIDTRLYMLRIAEDEGDAFLDVSTRPEHISTFAKLLIEGAGVDLTRTTSYLIRTYT